MRNASILRNVVGVILAVMAVFAAQSAPAEAGETSLSVWGDAGDFIIGDQQLFFTADNSFTVTKNNDNGVSLWFNSADDAHWWHLDFAAPYKQLLTQGSYPEAKTFPFNTAGDPGLSLDGDGRACDITGTFQVKQVVYGAGNAIESFWATFEQHCLGSGPGAYGEFRFNADIGADSVVVAAPLTVSVPRAEDLSFDVVATSGDDLPIALTATELPAGATFVDNGDNTATFVWTPTFDQAEQYTVTFRGENGSGLSDVAITVITVTGPTSLSLAGQPPDYIIGNQQLFFTPADGFFTVTKNFNNGVSISFDYTESWWDLDFAGPNNQPLTVGLYNGAVRFPFQGSRPGLDLSGDGRGCNTLTGLFEVKQIVYGAGNAIDKFWATFEQHCEGGLSAALGEMLFNADAVMLKISEAGNGHGSVTSTALGINCGRICARAATQGSVVDLQVVPDSDSVFTGWSGDPDCVNPQITLDVDKFCTATFTLKTYSVTIQKIGSGNGTVVSSPAAIDCGATCSATVNAGTLSLTASPSFDSVFVGWSGAACNGSGTCTFTVAADTTVTAEFATGVPLSVVKTGSGAGTITSSPGGINCGETCEKAFMPGTAVTLNAVPFFGSFFIGWSGGGCSGTGACTVALTSATDVTANFVPVVELVVTKNGLGNGTVTSKPAGIACPGNCFGFLPEGTVTLTATPQSDSKFDGWSGGGCSGTGYCVVNLNELTFVSASFSLRVYYVLQVTSGTVTTSTGVTCSGVCNVDEALGTELTLTATPDAGWDIATFSGDYCNNVGLSCTFVFTYKPYPNNIIHVYFSKSITLTVAKTGNGSGVITSYTGEINCGSQCSTKFAYPRAVVLFATPAPDSVFTGWSSSYCPGTGYCGQSIDSDTTITANFALRTFNVNVSKAGAGTGTVTSSAAGITCGQTCGATGTIGSQIVLNATASADSIFTGWSGGGCSGTGACTVTINADMNVTATFALKTYNLAVSKSGAGSGTVSGGSGAINCGASCSTTANIGSSITLAAAPSANSVFLGWSGACGGTGACALTMISDTAVSASFALKTFTLNAAIDGSGSGSISSSPLGISCGSDCAEVFSIGTSVNLTATASPDSVFTGWGGACGGAGACSVTMNADTAVTANFTKRLTLLSPNGGQVWRKGTNQTIAWTSTGMNAKAKVKVDYSADGGSSWTTIIKPMANDGNQKWKVNKLPTGQGRMRVCTTTAPIICDVSDGNFTIQ